LAVVHLLTYIYVKPIFVDLDVEMSALTRWLMHPMSLVMFFTIAVAVFLGGMMTEDRSQRRRTGKLAVVFGIVAISVWVAGIIVPLVSLVSALG
jgi:hypothetical protein